MDLTFLADAPPAPPGDEAPRSRIQIAKTGRFKDARYGLFSIQPADFDTWIKNFRELHKEVQVDLDHASEKGGSSEAAGWVKDLIPEGDKLFADVEWTPVGASAIREKRFRFLSPAYGGYSDEQGNVHKNVLRSVSLVNRPFLRDMAAVTLSQASIFAEEQPLTDDDQRALTAEREASDSRRQMADMKNIAKALGLPEDASEQQILSSIGGLKSKGSESKGSEKPWEKKDEKPKSLEQAAADDGKVLLSEADWEATKSDAALGKAASEKLHETTFEVAFTKHLDRGAVAPAEKDDLKALYELGPDQTLKALDTRAPMVNTAAKGSSDGGDTGEAPEGVDEDSFKLDRKVRALAASENIDYVTALDRVQAEEGGE